MRVWSSLRCILPHATGPHSQLSEAPWHFCFFLEIPTGSCLTSLCTCVIKLPLNGASCDTDAAFGCSRLMLHSFKQGEHFPAQNHSKSEISLFFLSTSDCLCISVSLKLCGENYFSCFPRKAFHQNLDSTCQKGHSRENNRPAEAARCMNPQGLGDLFIFFVKFCHLACWEQSLFRHFIQPAPSCCLNYSKEKSVYSFKTNDMLGEGTKIQSRLRYKA